MKRLYLKIFSLVLFTCILSSLFSTIIINNENSKFANALYTNIPLNADFSTSEPTSIGIEESYTISNSFLHNSFSEFGYTSIGNLTSIETEISNIQNINNQNIPTEIISSEHKLMYTNTYSKNKIAVNFTIQYVMNISQIDFKLGVYDSGSSGIIPAINNVFVYLQNSSIIYSSNTSLSECYYTSTNTKLSSNWNGLLLNFFTTSCKNVYVKYNTGVLLFPGSYSFIIDLTNFDNSEYFNYNVLYALYSKTTPSNTTTTNYVNMKCYNPSGVLETISLNNYNVYTKITGKYLYASNEIDLELRLDNTVLNQHASYLISDATSFESNLSLSAGLIFSYSSSEDISFNINIILSFTRIFNSSSTGFDYSYDINTNLFTTQFINAFASIYSSVLLDADTILFKQIQFYNLPISWTLISSNADGDLTGFDPASIIPIEGWYFLNANFSVTNCISSISIQDPLLIENEIVKDQWTSCIIESSLTLDLTYVSTNTLFEFDVETSLIRTSSLIQSGNNNLTVYYINPTGDLGYSSEIIYVRFIQLVQFTILDNESRTIETGELYINNACYPILNGFVTIELPENSYEYIIATQGKNETFMITISESTDYEFIMLSNQYIFLCDFTIELFATEYLDDPIRQSQLFINDMEYEFDTDLKYNSLLSEGKYDILIIDGNQTIIYDDYYSIEYTEDNYISILSSYEPVDEPTPTPSDPSKTIDGYNIFFILLSIVGIIGFCSKKNINN